MGLFESMYFNRLAIRHFKSIAVQNELIIRNVSTIEYRAYQNGIMVFD